VRLADGPERSGGDSPVPKDLLGHGVQDAERGPDTSEKRREGKMDHDANDPGPMDSRVRDPQRRAGGQEDSNRERKGGPGIPIKGGGCRSGPEPYVSAYQTSLARAKRKGPRNSLREPLETGPALSLSLLTC